MVTTRGKKIKFEADSSDGEVKDEEQVVKPALKRRKTTKSKPSKDDAAFAPGSSTAKGKEKETSEQAELITRRGGRGGKLRDLMNMPIDIFTEVCSYLDPHDLRRLSLASKRLWDILMSKESRHIWKAALETVPDLPECPTDLNEPQYVCLLYSSECYAPGCNNRATKTDWFHRLRYCPTCHDANMANEWDVKRDVQNAKEVQGSSGVWGVVYDIYQYFDNSSVMHLARTYSRRSWRQRNSDRTYHTASFKQAVIELLGLSSEQRHEKYAQLKEEYNYKVKTGREMLTWKQKQQALRSEDIATEKAARFESIKVKLLELGWEEKDFPMDKEFRDLVYKDQKLTPKIWTNILPKLEPLLQEQRTLRLEAERARRRHAREDAVRDFYHQIGHETMALGILKDSYRGLLPDVEEVFKMPSIKILLDEDTETITEEQWIEVAHLPRRMVIKWWRDSLKDLVAAVEVGQYPPVSETESQAAVKKEEDITEEKKGRKGKKSKKETKPVVKKEEEDVEVEVEETEDGMSAAIEVYRSQLSLVTSATVCPSSYSCGRTVWWFPHTFRHAFQNHYFSSFSHCAKLFQPVGPSARELITNLLRNLGFDDPESVTSSQVVDEDDGSAQKHYMCTRCDERVAKYMTFCEIINHYRDHQKWYDKATEAVKRSPDGCYPSRTVKSTLPKIVNDHDWTSRDALLVRKDDEKTKDAVLKLQTAFRKEEMANPLYDTQGIGGDELERNPWREVKWCCLLCPKDYGPSALSTKKMELHVKWKHDKECNLDTDATLDRHYADYPCPF